MPLAICLSQNLPTSSFEEAEKLKSLPHAESYLKPGLSFQEVDKIACSITDNQAAEQMNQAKSKIFQTINGQVTQAA
uniref:Uncharacterized protein n=1 Tax=Candidatus Kentrum sp. LFY TaxID=2126342 RepID=A0A450UMW7_9GAMM|nr:MAG: hypothetical protein BECKLFY1418B_GA0070995_10511 [Candidatus Kentron sp. LFY]VFK21626.1 MAG: hypothetical protein BECKLFY1418C_GA0070996_10982 [Candidatus Kentron sp. LFY]